MMKLRIQILLLFNFLIGTLIYGQNGEELVPNYTLEKKVINENNHDTVYPKNAVGLRSIGPLFLGNVSVFYSREIKQMEKYQLNFEVEVLYGGYLSYTYNLGGGVSLNNYIGKRRHRFVAGIGSYYLFYPEIIRNPNNKIYTKTGVYLPKQSVSINLRLGWQYYFNTKWTMSLSYLPSISYAKTWEYYFYSDEPNYQWRFYKPFSRGLIRLAISFLYHF